MYIYILQLFNCSVFDFDITFIKVSFQALATAEWSNFAMKLLINFTYFILISQMNIILLLLLSVSVGRSIQFVLHLINFNNVYCIGIFLYSLSSHLLSTIFFSNFTCQFR